MITVIGAGRVGSSAAARMADSGLDDIMLVDIARGLARGEALDIGQCCSCGVKVSGSEDFAGMRGSDLIINTAGISRKPDMTRLDLAARNAEITSSIAAGIRKYAPGSVVIQVANPVDLMTYVMIKKSGLARQRVMGMGSILDTMRLSYFLAAETGADLKKVQTMVIGEHGDSMVPLLSQTMVNNRYLSDVLSDEKVKSIVERTRKGGAEVMGLKGSTFHAPSKAIETMAELI
jgi:malate dehydrogenase